MPERFLTYTQTSIGGELVAVIAHTEEGAHSVQALAVPAQAPLHRTLVHI